MMWPFTSSEFASARQAASRAEYDYIIVGGGTAGCTIARRLSEADPSTTILLIERGKPADNWVSRIPFLSHALLLGYAQSFSQKTAPAEHLNGRTLDIHGGRALGGSSRNNGLMYFRGVAGEFNEWAEQGREGWSYDEVEPFFKMSQKSLDPQQMDYQGHQGPWTTKRHSDLLFPPSQKVIDASVKLGIPVVSDANSPDESPVGITHIHQTITSTGRRNSTYHAFLPQSYRQACPNLIVCTNTLVRKIDVSTDFDRPKACGVTFQTVGSHKVYSVKAKKEIVLTCGALFTPQLLMLSGIGPGDHLSTLDIPVVKNLPGVGSSLQDHMGISVEYQVPLADSFYGLVRRPWKLLVALFVYMIWGTGVFTIPSIEVATFMRSDMIDKEGRYVRHRGADERVNARDSMQCPDFEIMVVPNGDPRRPGFDHSKGVMGFLVSILRPESTGTVRLRSPDPLAFPSVDLGFLACKSDYNIGRSALRLCMRYAQEIQQAGYPIQPLKGVVPESGLADGDDGPLDAFMRSEGTSLFHYGSSCRMAPEDDPRRPGVVDDELRVHGIDALRIADASVFPRSCTAHPMASVVMVAEKCAHMMMTPWSERRAVV